MRRLLSFLAVAALLLAACADDDDATDDETTQTTVEDTSDEEDESTTTTTVETTTSTTEPDDEGDDDLPDGTAAERLEAAGMLRDGQAWVGPAAPEDRDLHLALCDHLFGTPSEVADLAGFSGEVTLDEDSGYESAAAEGDGVQCLYVVDGVDVLGALLWSSEADGGGDDSVLIHGPVDGGHHGLVAYNPAYDGPRLDEQEAMAWLNDAATRWGGATA